MLVIELLIKFGLKKLTSHAHLNTSVGPYIGDVLPSFDRDFRFCALYNKREIEYNLCTVFKLYAHAQQITNEED